jgi:hypothetical protein
VLRERAARARLSNLLPTGFSISGALSVTLSSMKGFAVPIALVLALAIVVAVQPSLAWYAMGGIVITVMLEVFERRGG